MTTLQPPTHHSPATTHHSPVTTHDSPVTTHHSPLTTHQTEPKLLDQVRAAARARRLAPHIEQSHVDWITRFILFHHKRHPRELGVRHIRAFVYHLRSTHPRDNSAHAAATAIRFLYREVLKCGPSDAPRDRRPNLSPPASAPSIVAPTAPIAAASAASCHGSTGQRVNRATSPPSTMPPHKPAPSASIAGSTPPPSATADQRSSYTQPCPPLATHHSPHSTDQTKPKLLDQVRNVLRLQHLALSTEKQYVYWIRHFILFHGKRHPLEMGKIEVTQFLTHLAVGRHVSASTQNQALCALQFLYKNVLERDIGLVEDVVRAKKPKRLPAVFTRAEVKQVLAQLEGTRRTHHQTVLSRASVQFRACEVEILSRTNFHEVELT